MLAKILALALVSQVAADGLTIDPNIPGDLTTWRWTAFDGKAALGWGKINAEGRFTPVSPRPEVPLYPVEAEAAPIEGVPFYAVNGVVANKLDDKGLTIRASDPQTADLAKQALYDGEGMEGKLKPLFPPLSIGPDWTEIGLYGVAAGLFVLSGVIFVRSIIHRPPRN